MTEKKKAPLSRLERSENSRKGAKKSPWSKWNPGSFAKDKKKRDWLIGGDK